MEIKISEQGKSNFEIKKWNPVVLWYCDVHSDICAICRTLIKRTQCVTKIGNIEKIVGYCE